ncbi:MAG: DNA polymerase III subunit alpha [Ignavibacterium sp.]|nr:MAG: DNA polymerase III subunit alpha [Ignavibacterium sp.]
MIPLHVHSYYSFLTGTIPPEQLIKKAVEYKLASLAITDTNAMNGIVPFVKEANQSNIKPIIGSVITDTENEIEYAILLAKNNEGYKDLCKIITSRKLNDDFSLINVLKDHLTNLIIITPSILIAKEINIKNDLYIELIATKAQKKINRRRFEFAQSQNLNAIVSNPVYFLNQVDHELQKAVTAIRLNTNLDNLTDDLIIDEEFYFKGPQQIDSEWASLPETIEATELIAQQCNVELNLNEYKFPVYELDANESADSLLWKKSFDGLSKRYEIITDEIKNRLEYELRVIREMNFSNYFLIVWDIVREAKRRGMMIIGRGSAANSITAYCLGLTQVDPIEHNLYFERFLNKARSSPPDFDIDFSWRERDEIVKYIFEKYGYENVAMISTTITFRARSAFREVAKAFGFTNEEISRISRKIPWTDAKNLPNLSKLFPESKDLDFEKEPWKTIVDIASRIARFPRHLSIHPGGLVITPTKITDYVALEYAKNKGLGLIITQPDMYSIEDMGLIKIDILSQRSLGVLRDSMEAIKNQKGEI